MRTLAIVLNVLLLGGVCAGTVAMLSNRQDAPHAWVVSLFGLVPIITLVALYSTGPSKGWVRLYFKRKALEEQARIDDLTKKQ